MIPLATAGRATTLRRAVQRPNPHLNISRRVQSSKPALDNGTTTKSTKTNQTVPPPNSTGAGAGASVNASTTAQTIPIPGNSWLLPFQVPLRYFAHIHRRRPYTTQLVSTLTIWFLGDLSAQYITSSPATQVSNSESGGDEEEAKTASGFIESYDPKRTARALLIGGVACIPSYRWLIWLGESFNWRSKVASISFKVVFNQFTFTPVFNVYFFSMQTILTHLSNGQTVSMNDVVERVRHTVPSSWVNSWKVWPVVTFISFWAIPIELRNIFAGVVAIGWQTYLGILNQRAAGNESAHVAAAAPEDTVGAVGKKRDSTVSQPRSKERATA